MISGHKSRLNHGGVYYDTGVYTRSLLSDRTVETITPAPPILSHGTHGREGQEDREPLYFVSYGTSNSLENILLPPTLSHFRRTGLDNKSSES